MATGTIIHYYPTEEGTSASSGKMRLKITETWDDNSNTSSFDVRLQMKAGTTIGGTWSRRDSAMDIKFNGQSVFRNDATRSGTGDWVDFYSTPYTFPNLAHDLDGELEIPLVVGSTTANLNLVSTKNNSLSLAKTEANYKIIAHKNEVARIHIDTGTAFEPYIIHIDDGSRWVRAYAYIDTGTSWVKCV